MFKFFFLLKAVPASKIYTIHEYMGDYRLKII
jgi:hypothetical protein